MVPNDDPSNIYKSRVGAAVNPALAPVQAPRNAKQVQKTAYNVRQHHCLSHDAIYNLVEISYDLEDFVHKVVICPTVAVQYQFAQEV